MGLRDSLKATLPPEARILVIDIELQPGTAYYWQPKVDYISPHMAITKPSMICFDAKWYGSPQHIFRSVWDDGPDKMVADVRDLLDQAHIVIGYNSAGFDVKHLNREIIQSACRTPPSPFFDVDLIRTARSRFKFPYNSLNEVCRDLNLQMKLEHSGWDLWAQVMAGDAKARKTMQRYNRTDVEVTEGLYGLLRPWIKGHPNVNMFRAERISGCHVCGSDDLDDAGFKYAQTRAYKRFRCNGCGAFSQSTHHEPEMAQHRKGAT